MDTHTNSKVLLHYQKWCQSTQRESNGDLKRNLGSNFLKYERRLRKSLHCRLHNLSPGKPWWQQQWKPPPKMEACGGIITILNYKTSFQVQPELTDLAGNSKITKRGINKMEYTWWSNWAANQPTLWVSRAPLIVQLVKNLPAMQETPVQFLGWEDPLEKE